MEVLDVIKQLCKSKNVTLAQLENALEFGNGSIAKSKGNMSADRMFQIAQYFNVSMEYLMTGKTVEDTDSEIAILRQQQSILIDINKVNQEMTAYYQKISDCQNKLTQLKKDYSKLESKKKVQETEQIVENTDIDWDIPFDEELPFN